MINQTYSLKITDFHKLAIQRLCQLPLVARDNFV